MEKTDADYKSGKCIELTNEAIERPVCKVKILLATTAFESHKEILKFLQKDGRKKKSKLLKTILLSLKELFNSILKFQKIEAYPNVHYPLIAKKQVKIYFTFINENEVLIKFFWSCRNNPYKLNYLL